MEPVNISAPEEEMDPFFKTNPKKLDATEEDTNDIIQPAAKEQLREKAFENMQFTNRIPGVGAVNKTLDSAALGVGDFVFDAVGLVPWLKPVEKWWDAGSPKSSSPAYKIIRDASSIIIPSMVGGGWAVGAGKAFTATKAVTLPSAVKTLGSIAAYTGVDTGVAMISSHSKTDDNIAATLNNWLGWNIPWATRTGDDPDTRWKKNVMESAGLAAGVELLGVAFTFGKKARLFPRDSGAEEIINAKKTSLAQYKDPYSKAIEPTRVARESAQVDEAIKAFKADPDGVEYNAFIHDVGPDDVGKAVVNLEADPLQAKLHQTQIQQNLGSLHGRAAPVVDESFNTRFMKAIDGNERAQYLDVVFDSLSPHFDAVIANGPKEVRIKGDQMNRAVDNLTQAIYGNDVSFTQFQNIVDDMKTTIFKSNEVLLEDEWITASKAFKQAYDTIFDPNQMRASAMISQQAADNVADAAAAVKMLGDGHDTSRQFEIMFDKMNLLDNEVRINKYIVSKAQEFTQIKKSGSVEAAASWLNKLAPEYDTYIKRIRNSGEKLRNELMQIAKTNPSYFEPLKEAYYATDGNVDTLHKMNVWTEKNIGLLKNGIIDGDPETPSLFVKGLNGVRINGLLSGLSTLRAAVGNSMLTAIKPVSVFAGAAARGDVGVLKRAFYTYGGISENFKRGFKVMTSEWKLANAFPEEAMMRGRTDMRLAKTQAFEAMDARAEVWRKEGEFGKFAMWNMTKAVTWWTKQPFVRYGTNALYAIDGMTNSFSASGMARARAYDELFKQSQGGIIYEEFNNLQRRLYDEAFDPTGLLTDEAAKFASKEIALNLDNAIVNQLTQFMDYVPAAKSIFMFPRTGVNATELAWSFNPLSNIGPTLTRARKTLSAHTGAQKLEALAEHGIDATQDADLAFNTLKSEYIGRQIMGSSVVMGAGLWAVEGNLTGNGPQNHAERSRMIRMGFKPRSIRNPITGEWRSYDGFAPFDQLLSLIGDGVFQANRVDQSFTEDLFRKIAASITMNVTNDTFLGGFEPLLGIISGDPSAWTKFFALQTDMMIPYKGVRSILNNAIAPQLKDTENDYLSLMARQNKFLFRNGGIDDPLKDMLDVYTGKPIRWFDTFTSATNAVLPFFKTNGSTEPWRQWLLATGWDGLSKPRVHPDTGLPLKTQDQYFLNNWIAKHANLRGQIIDLMSEDNNYWNKAMKDYRKYRGLKKQSQYPIKNWVVHQKLNEIHDRAIRGAFYALDAYNQQFSVIGREIRNRNNDLKRGRAKSAFDAQKRVQDLQNIAK